MRRSWFLILAIVIIGFASSCKKEEPEAPGNPGIDEVRLVLEIDLSTTVELLKNSPITNWTHPVNTITVSMTNTQTGDVTTEQFATIDALNLMVLPGAYLLEVSTDFPENESAYLQFSGSEQVTIESDMKLRMKPDLDQSLLTVTNSSGIAQARGKDLFEKDGTYYMYLVQWDGKWTYDGKTFSTSEPPVPGFSYHFHLSEDGSANEVITDWENNHESVLDRLVRLYLYDDSYEKGFLVTSDPAEGALWKERLDNQTPSSSITAPIAHMLYLSGYKKEAILGYEANYYHIKNGNELVGSSLYGLMGGYEATGDEKYKILAEEILLEVTEKFRHDGTNPPSNARWAYDYLNYLEGARKAAQAGIPGANEYLDYLVEHYLSAYKEYAQDDQQRLFINMISKRLYIGEHQGSVAWNDSFSLQDAAAGLLGNSWVNRIEVSRLIINDLLKNPNGAVDLAEAIFALSN
jgi:hypothetical protein